MNYHGDVKPLCYAIENDAGVEIFSIGKSLEIIKDIGTVTTALQQAPFTTEWIGVLGSGYYQGRWKIFIDAVITLKLVGTWTCVRPVKSSGPWTVRRYRRARCKVPYVIEAGPLKVRKGPWLAYIRALFYSWQGAGGLA